MIMRETRLEFPCPAPFPNPRFLVGIAGSLPYIRRTIRWIQLEGKGRNDGNSSSV